MNTKIIIPLIFLAMLIASIYWYGVMTKTIAIKGDEDDDDDDNGDTSPPHNETETEPGDDHEEDMDEHEEEHEDDGEHVGVIDHEDELEVDSDDNEIMFKKDKPKFEYEYLLNVNGTTIEVSIHYVGNKIIEFVDSNNNSMIDDDEKLNTLDLSELSWNVTTNIEYVPNTTNISSITLKYRYVDSEYNITITFYVAAVSNMIDGGADKVKIDFRIDKWPWASNESFLGIYTETEVSVESEDYGGIINATGNIEEGIYIDIGNISLVEISFNKTVIVDGITQNIINNYWKHYENEVEIEEGETEVEVEFKTYTILPHFNDYLYYDPKVGVEDDPNDVDAILASYGSTYESLASEEGSTALNGYLVYAGIIAGLIVIGIVFVARRRKHLE